ncbi:bifunctional diguanylate cyclase/phosphodiesterase [Caminibacter pacificus]
MKTYNLIFTTKKELEEFFKKLPKKENLIQIFSGVLDKGKIKEVTDTIIDVYPNAKIIGTTTDGEIIDGKTTFKKIVISVSLFDKVKVKTLLLPKYKRSYLFGKEFAKKLVTKDSKVLIAFADAMSVNGEDFINGIESESEIIVSGGLAGDNARFKHTFVFDEANIIQNGAVGAVLEGDIIVNNELGFNWEGIGKSMKIEKAIKNRVYRIDGKTPVELYKHYFGEEFDNIAKIGIRFPLIVKRDKMYVARAVLKQFDDGSVLLAGNVNEGEEVRFGFADVSSILYKDEELFKKISGFDVESIFIYSCMARKRFLGGYIKNEIRPFSKVGSVSGFFTYGEFFSRTHNYFFNQTLTVLALSENERKVKIDYEYNRPKKFFTLKALTNLIKNTSQELNELNKNLEEILREKTKQIMRKSYEMEHMFYYDQLTDLPNKYLFEKDIEVYDVEGMVLVDIRHFFRFNDLYGESIGDLILKEIAKKLLTLVDNKNIKLYRWGADQFIFVGFEKRDFVSLGKKVLELLHEKLIVKIDKTSIPFDFEAVVSVVDKKYKNMKAKADLALNYAKRNNLNFIIYDKSLDMESSIRNEINTLKKVKRAIKEDRIIPVFQKIEKKDSVSYESLLRIRENNKLITPGEFLDVIRFSYYYFEVMKIMIEKTLSLFSKREEKVSLNFTYRDITNKNVVKCLIDQIKKHNMQNKVILEIVESEDLKDFQKVHEFIKRVRKEGVEIAIDDFGSGYSNFVYLTELKPDYIKIDGSLIKNIHKDHNSYIITKNILNFAKDMNCKTIAEYVENEEIYKKVKEMGFDGYQGNYIHKPQEEP